MWLLTAQFYLINLFIPFFFLGKPLVIEIYKMYIHFYFYFFHSSTVMRIMTRAKFRYLAASLLH